MKCLICICFIFIFSNILSANSDNCQLSICPKSEWNLRKKVDDINYEPIVWTSKTKKEENNFLLAKMKHSRFSSIKELKNIAISQFAVKRFHWKKELLSKKNIIVAQVNGPKDDHQFFQGYLKSKSGSFYNLNCMSTKKITKWNSCKELFELVASRL